MSIFGLPVPTSRTSAEEAVAKEIATANGKAASLASLQMFT